MDKQWLETDDGQAQRGAELMYGRCCSVDVAAEVTLREYFKVWVV